MESEGIIHIDKLIEANRWMWSLAMIMFWSGAAALSLYIKKVNNFTYRESFLAITGFKKFKRNWKINLGQVLVIIIPLILMSYVISAGNNI